MAIAKEQIVHEVIAATPRIVFDNLPKMRSRHEMNPKRVCVSHSVEAIPRGLIDWILRRQKKWKVTTTYIAHPENETEMNSTRAMDADVAQRLKKEAMSGDQECDHIKADEIVVGLLARLGFTETVAAYEMIEKWYA